MSVHETSHARKDFSGIGKEIPKPTTEDAQSGNEPCTLPQSQRMTTGGE